MDRKLSGDDWAQAIRDQAGSGKRIALVTGNFNILHPGHIRLLRFAAEAADFLVVAVHPDGAVGVATPLVDRLDGVSSLEMVDAVIALDEPVISLVARLRPDIVVKGKEYEARENPEQAAIQAYGGKLLFSSGEMRLSSAFLEAHPEALRVRIHKPHDYPQRHGFSISGLRRTLERMAGLRVLVIGDLIVDTYVDCDPIGMSQEDPTLVVAPIEERSFVGGAGIVAAHAAGLGAVTRFISVTGQDDEAAFARRRLVDYGVECDLLTDTTRPTTLKRRYRARDKTLLRVNRLRQHPVEQEIAGALIAKAAAALPHTDLLLFADFNYGCLPQSVVDAIAGIARGHNVVMCADSQASSQISDISRYKGMDLITPTEREARLALRDFESGLVIVAEELQKSARAKHVILTLGGEGVLNYAEEGGAFKADLLPAFNTAPKDVAGAGDSLFTSTALAMAAGVDFWEAAYLGGLAAACQVSRVGNTPLSVAELLAEIDEPEG